MEVRTGNYSDIIKLEEYKGKWQLVLCNEYNGETRPCWCMVERGPNTYKLPISIILGDSKEAAKAVLKSLLLEFEEEPQAPLPGHGTPAGRYGGRRL
jgi:hypothetical protein